MPSEFLSESLRIIGVHGVQALPVDAFSVPYRNTDLFLCFSAHTGHYCTDVVRQLSLTDEKPHSILVTMNPKHPLRKSFDQIIALPQASSSGGTRMILNDTMAFMMFVDRITNLITKKLFPAPDEQ